MTGNGNRGWHNRTSPKNREPRQRRFTGQEFEDDINAAKKIIYGTTEGANQPIREMNID